MGWDLKKQEITIGDDRMDRSFVLDTVTGKIAIYDTEFPDEKKSINHLINSLKRFIRNTKKHFEKISLIDVDLFRDTSAII